MFRIAWDDVLSAFALAGGFLVVLALAGCGEPKSAENPPPRPVRAQAVVYEPLAERLTFAGTIEPRYLSSLGFRTSGKMVARLVDVGMSVKAGQPLARLDPQDYDLQIRTIEAQVLSARADLVRTRQDFERYRQLQDSPAFNRAVFDQRRAAYDMARARLDQMQGQLRMAENQLVYTTLYADTDGVVTAIRAEAGQVVAQGQTVLVVARTDELEVAISLPEGRLGELREASDARFTLFSDPERTHLAVLREVSPVADAMTRTYSLRYSIPDAPPELRIGMSATLMLARPRELEVAVLPLTAIFQDGTRPAVWVVDPATGALELRAIELAGYRQDAALVAGGVEAGALVVTAGVQKLDRGQQVRLMTPAPR
ncbi:MAG: efflux RND transporter periplasmic adaptor subunit [Alphaproteobacteria bacterium]|nr:efflux RND transporter periplasmic adaptor subunit [Alphaproteobacteria bacterium]